MTARTVTMTVYKIEADLLDITPMSSLPGTTLVPGYVTFTAQGQGHTHEWRAAYHGDVKVGDHILATIEVPGTETP